MPDGWWSIIVLPFISAVIGWITNLLAITMLFRPRTPRRILWWTLWGLLPRRQAELARSIAAVVSDELLSQRDIAEFLKQSAAHKHLRTVLQERLDAVLEEKLGGLLPILVRYLSSDLHSKIKETVGEVVDPVISWFITKAAENFEEVVDFRAIVEEKVNTFDLADLERLVRQVAGRELRSIEYFGGVLGFLIGWVQVLVLALSR